MDVREGWGGDGGTGREKGTRGAEGRDTREGGRAVVSYLKPI